MVNNNCKYFRIRTRQYKKYFYCIKNKEMISLNNCYMCDDKEYKERKTINKISKKRITVSEKTYDEVYKKCNGQCQICYTTNNLHYHHILYRSERRDLIDDPSNGIMLCTKCHKIVHSNKHYWQPILLERRKKL